MSARTKIAIIEDDKLIRDLYKLKLSLESYIVETASNGVDGLKLVKKFRPDLVLLDLKMPQMSGEEMLEKMRSTAWGSKPIVIVLTNISRDEAPHKLRFLNVYKYIVKAHHTPNQVLKTIEKTLDAFA